MLDEFRRDGDNYRLLVILDSDRVTHGPKGTRASVGQANDGAVDRIGPFGKQLFGVLAFSADVFTHP